MKASKAILVCVCLIGLTQLVWSQNQGFPASRDGGIARYLDSRAGMLTPQAQRAADASPELTGTSILFREQFNVTVTNDDQSTSDAVTCVLEISTEDYNGYFDDTARVFATRSGSTYTCDVPVLALWTLQTPTTDSIYACLKVSFAEGITVGPNSTAYIVRHQEYPCQTLSVPGNDQTVITTVSVTM